MILITGKKGEAHVTSIQHRNIISALAGTGSYIANIYSNLEPTIENNTLNIAAGVLIHHGCVMQVDHGTFDTVALTQGTAGYYRKDYVVARWTQNGEGIESAEWVLLRGTPSNNAASAEFPTYNSENMQEGAIIDDCPVFAITYDGLTPAVETVPTVIQLARKSEAAEANDVFYQPGDRVHLTLGTAGYMTGGTVDLRFLTPWSKLIGKVSGVRVLGGTVTLRQNNKYLAENLALVQRSGNSGNAFPEIMINGLWLTLTKNSGWGGINNDTVGITGAVDIEFS